jgi:tRNA A37 threonylcarbamoyladenosine biosynthesis protein TsaE
MEERDMIRGIFLAVVLSTFAVGSAMAQETCETKAVSKDGKALAGAAKTSFMKKCMADTCATKAVSSDGKPLSGAAKNSFMKKCEQGA